MMREISKIGSRLLLALSLCLLIIGATITAPGAVKAETLGDSGQSFSCQQLSEEFPIPGSFRKQCHSCTLYTERQPNAETIEYILKNGEPVEKKVTFISYDLYATCPKSASSGGDNPISHVLWTGMEPVSNCNGELTVGDCS